MPMNKKHVCPPPGAPEWVVTYGDLMGLLMTFFILLLSMSELRKDSQYDDVVQGVQQAFGMSQGNPPTYLDEPTKTSLMKLMEFLSFRSQTGSVRSRADDPGIEGREQQVTRVREGMIFAKGGRITFEPGSAELSEEMKRRILSVADQIKGYNNVIEVRGHAASMELVTQSQYKDLWELSYARAKAVMTFLTSEQVGIEPQRIRVIAQADHAPLATRAYTTGAQEPNRRVELFQTEALAEEYRKPESSN